MKLIIKNNAAPRAASGGRAPRPAPGSPCHIIAYYVIT